MPNLFGSFTLLVMIVLLNVLIAVVSDGYDFAMMRSRSLFFRARLGKQEKIRTAAHSS
jgi:hypothetical protein